MEGECRRCGGQWEEWVSGRRMQAVGVGVSVGGVESVEGECRQCGDQWEEWVSGRRVHAVRGGGVSRSSGVSGRRV